MKLKEVYVSFSIDGGEFDLGNVPRKNVVKVFKDLWRIAEQNDQSLQFFVNPSIKLVRKRRKNK